MRQLLMPQNMRRAIDPTSLFGTPSARRRLGMRGPRASPAAPCAVCGGGGIGRTCGWCRPLGSGGRLAGSSVELARFNASTLLDAEGAGSGNGGGEEGERQDEAEEMGGAGGAEGRESAAAVELVVEAGQIRCEVSGP